MPREFFRSCIVLILVTALLTAPTPQAVRAAGPWYVSITGDDNNDCLSPSTPCATIDGAIGKATVGDTINVAVGTYTGTGTEVILIDRDITLSGGWDANFTTQSGMSTIDGHGVQRGITLNSGITAVIARFVVQNGPSGIYNGGGILTLNESSVLGNTTIGGGAGIGNVLGGILTLNASTVSGNKASFGGAIANTTNSTMVINNSTISGNTADSRAGGIYNSDGAALYVNNSTVYGNSSTFSPGGGGIYNEVGSVVLRNSIVAGNANCQNDGPDCLGTISSAGYNLIGDTTNCNFITDSGDLTNVNPNLGQLIAASGAPKYHPLLAGSPAIDAGNPTGCVDQASNPLSTDERGAVRIGTCDIGSYEYTIPGPASSLSVVSGSNQLTGISTAFLSPLQAAALDSQGSPVNGVIIDFSAPASGASGTFTNTNSNTTSAVTDESGVATTSTFTANDQAGAYSVTASATGLGSVNFDLEQVARPANDNFADAKIITLLPYGDSVDNTQATTEPGEPQPYFFSPRTVWYTFTPATNAVFIADMNGSNFGDTVLNVYQAQTSGFGGLNFLGYTAYGGSVTFSVQAGLTYYLQAGSIGSGGGDLHVNLQLIPPPLNDDFISATVIPSLLPFDDTVDTIAASIEVNEPYPSCGQGTGDKTVWYSFTPAESRSFSASILSSPFYPILAVYTGNSLASLTQVGCAVGWSVLTFRANASTTYYIQAGGYFDGGGGLMQFRLDVTPQPVAGFSWYPYDPSILDTIQFSDTSYDPGQSDIQSYTWNFGDGATATGSNPTHKFAADGNYTVQHSVTTVDGRTASITQVVSVKTHDVGIVKIAAPNSASTGQTRTITVTVRNKRYPETVTVDMYKSSPGGDVWVNSITLQVPVSSGNRTTSLSFNYTFTSQDAQVGKVTFRAVATIAGARDAYPSDNEAISSPPTKVSR